MICYIRVIHGNSFLTNVFSFLQANLSHNSNHFNDCGINGLYLSQTVEIFLKSPYKFYFRFSKNLIQMSLSKIFIILFFLVSLLHPQVPLNRIEKISIEHGLSSQITTCFLQDRDDFMWIGTLNGLNRYDGYTFTVYKKDADDPTSLSNNNISAIVQDTKGDLWIGTSEGGLNKFDRNNKVFKRFLTKPNDTNSLQDNRIFSLLCEDSLLWIGTKGSGLNLMNTSTYKFKSFTFEELNGKLTGINQINSIVRMDEQTLLLGTNSGLILFNTSDYSWKLLLHEKNKSNSLFNNIVSSIYKDGDGGIWIGTFGLGFQKFDSKTNTFTSYSIDKVDKKEFYSFTISKIIADKNGFLWLGTFGGKGLIRFDPKNKSFLSVRDIPRATSLISESDVKSRVMDLFLDKCDNLWIATWNHGVLKVDLKKKLFSLYSIADKNSNGKNSVWGIAEDQNASTKIWVCTNNGIKNYDLNSNEIVTYSIKDGLSSNNISGVVNDGADGLWLSTWGGGLNHLNLKKKKVTVYKHNDADPNSIPTNYISPLIKTHDGKLWMGTTDLGVLSFEPRTKKFSIYKNIPGDNISLSDNYVANIFEDSSGSIWICLWQGGLNRLDPVSGKVQRYMLDPDKTNSISSNIVLNIIEAENGKFWVGTGEGFNFFDPETNRFTVYSEKQGLIDKSVLGLRFDDRGLLWLSTSGGISRFNTVTKEFKNFTEHDGLQGREFAAKIYKSKTGYLVFPGINGFNVLYPNNVKYASNKSKVKFTGFRKLNKDVNLDQATSKSDELNLDYSDNSLSFDFALLDFTNPISYRYAYKMEGVDKDWIFPKNGRTANYTYLDPGNYRLLVKAANYNGVWSKPEIVTIIIRPPFYKTSWFTTFGILLTVYLGFFLYTSRVNKLKKRQAELLNLISEKEKIEKELRQNQELFEIIDNGVGDLIAILDLNGDRLYSSNSYTKLFGDASKLIGTNSFVDIHPDDRDKIKNIFFETVRSGKGQRTEFRFLLPNGVVRYVESHGNLIRDDEGNPSKVVVVSRDISERKFAEEKIIELNKDLERKIERRTAELILINENLQGEILERERSEAEEKRRTKLIINHRNVLMELAQLDKSDFNFALKNILAHTSTTLNIARVGFWSLENDNRLHCKKIFLREIAEIDAAFEGTTLPASFPGLADDAEAYKKVLMLNKLLVLPNSQNVSGSTEFNSYLKEQNIISMAIVPVWFQGVIIGIICAEHIGMPRLFSFEEEDFLTSITTMTSLSFEASNRKQAELSLKNSEEQYRLLVENANESILVAQDGMLKYVNPKTFEVIDFTAEELASKPFLEFVYPDDRELVMENYIKRLKGTATEDAYTFRIVRKDGKVRTVEINAVLINWKGKKATLNFLEDITDRVLVEEEMRKAFEKEKELSELRSRFVAMASHEFRTPLTTILTSAEIMDRFDNKLDIAQKKSYLNRIQDNVKHMTKLLNDVLIIGKSNSGKLVAKKETFDLALMCNGLIEQFEMTIQNSASNHQLLFINEIKQNDAFLDNKLIRQILENLLSNAIKYSPQKSKVVFQVKSDEKETIFIVKDQGIGISEEDLAQIYEPFHRGKNVGNISGTGLGLAITHRAVELHGGRIEIKSKLNKGTEFIISIPV